MGVASPRPTAPRNRRDWAATKRSFARAGWRGRRIGCACSSPHNRITRSPSCVTPYRPPPASPQSGARLHEHTPCSHWRTHTVIAALRLDGLSAPAVFDGSIDTPTFRAYVEQVLVPTLRPGDVVMLDNLAVHKQPEIRATIADARPHIRSCRLQSGLQPDRTSLRQTEAFLRAARPHSFDHVCELMATTLRLFTPTECANYVRHSGYRIATSL